MCIGDIYDVRSGTKAVAWVILYVFKLSYCTVVNHVLKCKQLFIHTFCCACILFFFQAFMFYDLIAMGVNIVKIKNTCT